MTSAVLDSGGFDGGFGQTAEHPSASGAADHSADEAITPAGIGVLEDEPPVERERDDGQMVDAFVGASVSRFAGHAGRTPPVRPLPAENA